MIAELLQTLIIVIGLGASANTNAQTPSFNNRQKFQTRENQTIAEEFITDTRSYDVGDNQYYEENTGYIQNQWRVYKYNYIKQTLQGNTNLNYTFEGVAYSSIYGDFAYYQRTGSNNRWTWANVNSYGNNARTEHNSTRLTILKMTTQGNTSTNGIDYNFGSFYDIEYANEIKPTYGITQAKMKIQFFVSTDNQIENYFNSPRYTQMGFNEEIIQRIRFGSIASYNQKTYEVDLGDYGGVDQDNLTNWVLNNSITTYIVIVEEIMLYQTGSQTPKIIFNADSTGMLTGDLFLDLNPTGQYTAVINTNNITIEVVDIPSVLFEVLTMPFTFYSVAFNLTLFAGTPYAINISRLILSILGILIFVFIVKKVLMK